VIPSWAAWDSQPVFTSIPWKMAQVSSQGEKSFLTDPLTVIKLKSPLVFCILIFAFFNIFLPTFALNL